MYVESVGERKWVNVSSSPTSLYTNIIQKLISWLLFLTTNSSRQYKRVKEIFLISKLEGNLSLLPNNKPTQPRITFYFHAAFKITTASK
jgi:hypothetical protein